MTRPCSGSNLNFIDQSRHRVEIKKEDSLLDTGTGAHMRCGIVRLAEFAIIFIAVNLYYGSSDLDTKFTI